MIDLEQHKFSALSKSMEINQYVTNTTIGPNSTPFGNTRQPVTYRSMGVQTTLSLSGLDDIPDKAMLINQIEAILEQKRQKEVQNLVSSRQAAMCQHLKKTQVDSHKNFQEKLRHSYSKQYQEELSILKEIENNSKYKLTQDQLQHNEELAERKKKIDKDLKEYERCKVIKDIILRVQVNQKEFNQIYQEVILTFQSYKYPLELKKVLENFPNELQCLPDDMQQIIMKCKDQTVTENDYIKSGQLVNVAKALLQSLRGKILEVTQQQEKEKEVIAKQKVVIKRDTENVAVPAEIKINQIDKFISKTSLKTYSELQQFLDNFTQSYEDLLKDDTMKTFKFNCKKAINIPVNAISAVNSQHLLDKYNKLSNLVQGKTVEVGDTRVCAAQHPQGIAFCLNLLAKKFILQGDLMISSKPEAAFCYAAIVSALWYDNEKFGKLLLAHLHRQCPYLVPLYPPRAVGQDDQEYYASLGYQYVDNIIEKQDKFLKRMTGIMRLYAAIIVTKPKKGQQRNLHGICEGWRWLSSFLNLEPYPDVTATLLHVFLEMAGSTLQIVYGKVFKKLMQYICQVYLPKIQKIDTGGPVTRLEVLLQDYIKQGQFDEPHGIFPINFW